MTDQMTRLIADVGAHIEATAGALSHHVDQGPIHSYPDSYRFTVGLDIADCPDSILIILEETKAGTVKFTSVTWFNSFVERQVEAEGLTHERVKELVARGLAYYVANLPTS